MKLDIGVDIDGVVRDLYHPLVSRFRKEIPKGWINDPEVWEQYDISHENSLGSYILKYWFEEWAYDLYNMAPAYENAIEDLYDLRLDGHKIHLISAQPNKDCEVYTTSWLKTNLVPYDSLHYIQEKWRVSCDIYVDDSPEQLIEYSDHKKYAIKYKQPWNKDANVGMASVSRLKYAPEAIWYLMD